MYNAFFGFNKTPFSLVPDPDFLYLSPGHKKAWIILKYGLLSQAGFTVVTGEIGAGKTTLIRKVLSSLPKQCEVGLITNTHSSFGDLLTWVLAAFNVSCSAQDKAGRYQAFVEFLKYQQRQNKRVILIVDEAQNMDLQTLEELRLLSNINVGQDILLQLVLAGQPELVDKLNSPELVQFAQRISAEYHLMPMDFEQTQQYIKHRVVVAGGSESLFDELACAVVYYYSGGIPRLINNICDLSLVYAFSEEKHFVTGTIVLEVVIAKKTSGIVAYKGVADEQAALLRKQMLAKYNIDIGLLA